MPLFPLSFTYLAFSGSVPETRSQPSVRARLAPEQQLAVKGEEGECVRPSPCLSASICLSVCVSVLNKQVDLGGDASGDL